MHFSIWYLLHNIFIQSKEWFEPLSISICSSPSKTASLATVFPMSIIKFTIYNLIIACKVKEKMGNNCNKIDVLFHIYR